MTRPIRDETSIGVTALQAQGHTSQLPNGNRTVSAIVPIVEENPNLNTLDDLYGAMRGMQTIAPGVDLTEPTGEIWDAEIKGEPFHN